MVPVGNLSPKLLPSEFVLERMQHNLPRLAHIVPTLYIKFLIQLHLLLRLTLLPLAFSLATFDELDDVVAYESAAVDHVVEDGEAQVLEMHSYLVGSASNGVAFEERRVRCLVVPNLFEDCPAILEILLCFILLNLLLTFLWHLFDLLISLWNHQLLILFKR
jgi:hypothetical protein